VSAKFQNKLVELLTAAENKMEILFYLSRKR